MGFFDLFNKNTAVIIDHNKATNEVQVSESISSIQAANKISSTIIADEGGFITDINVNDYDGHDKTFVAPSEQQNTWHVREHIVIPEKLLNDPNATLDEDFSV